MVRDFKYIIKLVIIGILIGLFFIMFKSCDVHAKEIIQNVSAFSYFQSQYCQETDVITDVFNGTTFTGSRFTCNKGPSYKFAQYLNSDNNTSVPFLLNENQLINSFSFEIDFQEPQTITSTNRYIGLRIPWLSSNISNGTIGLWDSYITLNGIKDNNTIVYSPSVSSFFFQPQYCSYSDGSNFNKCNVYFVADSSISRYVYYIDIPLGTNVSSITLFFGNNNIQSTYDLYTDIINNDFRAMTPTIWKLNSCTNNSTNYNCYVNSYNHYSQYSNSNFNIYGKNSFSGAGLIYYRYAPLSPLFTPSNRTDNLWFDSSYPSNPIIYNFSSVTSEEITYYNNLVLGIENELNPSEDDTIDGKISELMGSFAENENSQRYLTTFEALFSYPIQKMQEQSDYDLVNYNMWTNTKQLDSKLCWGTDPVLGDSGQPYKVQFFRDYKFTLPCPHSEIYTHLGYGNFGFYPSDFMGSNNVGYAYNFISIWLVIQHGILVYFLFVNVLNIYKYIIDSKKSEIEVLEL